MCGTVMRGADALPGSKATSRAKGSHRNLGGLGSGRQMLRERDGPHREGEEPKPMMHGHEKSDLVIVAVKPTNKARKAPCGGVCRGGRSGVGGAKGGGQGEYAPAKHVLDLEPGCACHRRWSVYGNLCRHTPEAGAVCGKAARTDSGRGACHEMHVPTATPPPRIPRTGQGRSTPWPGRVAAGEQSSKRDKASAKPATAQRVSIRTLRPSAHPNSIWPYRRVRIFAATAGCT